MKRLLLLGGGHAHVHVLAAMARERFAATEVTLLTPFARQLYSGMVPGVMAGHYRADEAAIELAPLAAAAGAHLVENMAVALDAARRLVRLADGRTLGYDVLSVDTGAAMDRGRLPGARAHALFVRPIEHFLGDIEDLFAAAVRQAEDVVVIGAGAAGVEVALALQHRLTALGESDGAAGRVALVLGGERPLPGYPNAVVQRAEAALQRARITLFRDSVTEVRADAVVLAHGARVACSRAVVVTGAEAPPWLAGSGLALDGHGFIVTGPTLQSGSHPEVFAAGDVATRIDAPHAKSGVHAVRAGPPLAANLRLWCALGAATGAQLRRHKPQVRTLNLISCGSRRAIASWGTWVAEGRWVWWWKNHIDRAFIARYAAPRLGAQPAAEPLPEAARAAQPTPSSPAG